MKIIGVDNYNRENISDILVAENVINEYLGNRIVEFLNYGRTLTKMERESFLETSDLISDTYYNLVPDDYKLYEFEY